jgi:DNA-binding IclR family transcriptional regulator
VAAVSISVPANRLAPELLPEIIADVRATALEISRKLGFRGEEGYK